MDAPKTIHYTQLPPAQPGSQLAREWETYRREVGRLLAEGLEGRWVLVKGDQVLAFFDTYDAARDAGSRLFLQQPHLIHQVFAEEPIRYHCYTARFRPCPT
jgi:hypothetical protein